MSTHGSVHLVLGKTQMEYEELLCEARRRGDVVLVSNDPNYHCHPALGIIGHLHKDGRTPHVHQPVVTWDHTPIYLEDS